MKIAKESGESTRGPSDWFTGTVYIDPIKAPSTGSRLNASSVRFEPGSRTAWHSHPNGQTIYITEGVARVGGHGRPNEDVPAGGHVFFEPGEQHWHGATPTTSMTHVSLVEVDEEGNSATWGAHVSDEEYA